MKHLLVFVFVILTLGIRHSSQAAIIFTDNADIPIPMDWDGVFLNLATGATQHSSSLPSDFDTAPWFNPFFGGNYVLLSDLANLATTGSDQLVALEPGAMVDSNLTFTTGVSNSTTHMGPAANQFKPNTPGYIGFQMRSSPTSNNHYGWMRVRFSNTGAGSILSYAYESIAGLGIAAGITAVPEPGRAMLLLIAATAFLFRRRR
jgi:hypothetical protein